MAEKFFIFGETYNGDGTGGGHVTFTTGTPGTVNFTGHGLANDQKVEFGISAGGSFPSGITAGTTYYVRNQSTNAFEIATTAGGASIALSGSPTGTFYCVGIAASNGGKGAWSQDSILTGTAPTYGTLLAGDVVYIRSKTGNGADADISKSFSSSFTLGAPSAVGTSTSPVTFILDNGAIWSGKNGTLTYTTSTATAGVTFRQYNCFFARTPQAWIIEQTHTTPSTSAAVFYEVETNGIYIKQPNRTNLGISGYGTLAFRGGRHENLSILVKQFGTSATVSFITQPPSPALNNLTEFHNLQIEATQNSTNSAPIFGHGEYASAYKVYGGRIFGTGTTSGCRLFLQQTTASSGCEFVGINFLVPKTVPIYDTGRARTHLLDVWLSGVDEGVNAEIASGWGNADSRNYSYNYPTLNATLPTSGSSPTAWRVVPELAAWWKPAVLPISKLYTSSAATKTVTLEFLVSNNWGAGAITTSSVWMNVTYIRNDTGVPFTETTRVPISTDTLDASSASWSGYSWGSVSFSGDSTNSRGKRKLSLTTSYSIKQDTAVLVAFCCAAASASAAYDIFIVDPDVQLT